MRFLPGRITMTDFAKSQGRGENTLLVNIAAVNTLLVTFSLGNLAVGDVVIAFGNVFATKGGVAGTCSCWFEAPAGLDFVEWLNSKFSPGILTGIVPIGAAWAENLVVMGHVIAAGNYDLNFYATSAGSNSACAAGDAQLAAFVVPGNP